MTTNKPFRIQETSYNNKATVTLNPAGDSYTVAWDHWQNDSDMSSITLPKYTVDDCFERGVWEMIVPEPDTSDLEQIYMSYIDTMESVCLLQQIKDFTDNYTAEVTIHNGICQILDADSGYVYRANDDESLVKIIEAFKLLADAVVEDGE